MAANFDFNSLLSPYDFELLVKDLINRDLSIQLSDFGEGPDYGIDLRFSKTSDNDFIVQCKRTKSISKKILLEEFGKISKLKPTKYFLAFSLFPN